ncbi:hypothetical protein Ddc_04092 [Ditylenchus destructor]|nr:hypothetical protein Ddc_04092 [Ditylenchus destructor]
MNGFTSLNRNKEERKAQKETIWQRAGQARTTSSFFALSSLQYLLLSILKTAQPMGASPAAWLPAAVNVCGKTISGGEEQ